MISIDSNNISITRGDSAVIKLVLDNSDGTSYTRGDSDVIKFNVKNGDTILFSREVKEDIITIVPENTSSLSYASYTYEVTITTGGSTYTAIRGAKFVVESEVTF
jgi:hypothetical protein